LGKNKQFNTLVQMAACFKPKVTVEDDETVYSVDFNIHHDKHHEMAGFFSGAVAARQALRNVTIVVTVINGNVPESMRLFHDVEQANAYFLQKCEDNLSNWDEYTQEDKDALLDEGYETTPSGKCICITWPSFADSEE